jgi:hypothetical protein
LESYDEEVRDALVVGMALEVAVGAWDAGHLAENAEVGPAGVVDDE